MKRKGRRRRSPALPTVCSTVALPYDVGIWADTNEMVKGIITIGKKTITVEGQVSDVRDAIRAWLE